MIERLFDGISSHHDTAGLHPILYGESSWAANSHASTISLNFLLKSGTSGLVAKQRRSSWYATQWKTQRCWHCGIIPIPLYHTLSMFQFVLGVVFVAVSRCLSQNLYAPKMWLHSQNCGIIEWGSWHHMAVGNVEKCFKAFQSTIVTPPTTMVFHVSSILAQSFDSR
jgi:hypothetical protein